MRFKELLQHDSITGITLLVATAFAVVLANVSPLIYSEVINLKLTILLGEAGLSKPLHLWINDGLMAIFFFYIGLELKREFLTGHLSNIQAMMLPAAGAVGGIIVPVLIFYAFNSNNSINLQGWAIPAATDIAFALAVLSCCAHKVPGWAKVFLLTLAIYDDLAAIVIIAIFYTSTISYISLLASLLLIIMMLLFNNFKIHRLSVYVICGIILWACVLKSGVHATLAGVVTALLIPQTNEVKSLEKNLSPWITFLVLPLFAFANTGINFSQLFEQGVTNPVSMGSAMGLFFGKQIGVFLFCLFGIKMFSYRRPKEFNYKILYGLSVLCGIGFTMSIFIASLSYLHNEQLVLQARAGVLLGSILSGILGYLILYSEFKKIKT